MPTLEDVFLLGSKLMKSGELSVTQKRIEAKGFVKRKNNHYLIVLNDSLSEDCKIKTLIHELVHIYMGHDHITPVYDEVEADQITEQLWNGGKSYERAYRFLQTEEW